MKVANLQQRKNDLDKKKGIDLQGINSIQKSRKASQDDFYYDKEDEVLIGNQERTKSAKKVQRTKSRSKSR